MSLWFATYEEAKSFLQNRKLKTGESFAVKEKLTKEQDKELTRLMMGIQNTRRKNNV